MGIERNNDVVEPEKSPDEGRPQPDQSPPPDRPGELGTRSRAESRRVATEANQKASEATTDTTDDANAAGGVETELEPVGDRTATAIEEGEDDRRSKLERLRGVGYKNAEETLDKAQNGINKTANLFERPPTGSHAVVKTDQPAVEVPHHGIDAGDAATAVLATGIVIGELIRRGRNKLMERGDK